MALNGEKFDFSQQNIRLKVIQRNLYTEKTVKGTVNLLYKVKNYRILSVLTHYLEMKNPPEHNYPEEKEHCLVMKMEDASIGYYRYLYKEVGTDISWVNRLVIEDDELHSIISDNAIKIYVLYYMGCPAGYAEIDLKDPANIELTYFGLMPRYRGLGLGKYFLEWVIKKSWSFNPERFWLHTCELDHEAALPLFEKAGFKVYNKSNADQVILD